MIAVGRCILDFRVQGQLIAVMGKDAQCRHQEEDHGNESGKEVIGERCGA